MKITANRNTSNEEKDDNGKIIRQERMTGSYSRSFYVGDQIQQEDIKASFDNGELHVTIPTKEHKEIENNTTIPIE